MSVLTKERPTDNTVVLRIVGPGGNKAKVVEAIESLGFVESNDSVPWEEVFPESSPGTCLRGARHKEGLTQRQLAEMTGIPQRHISEMENDKRPIGKARAKILAKALNAAGYRVFL